MKIQNPQSTPKINRAELLRKVSDVIDSHSSDPAAELRTLGKALLEIGQALDGISPQEAKAVILAVAALNRGAA